MQPRTTLRVSGAPSASSDVTDAITCSAPPTVSVRCSDEALWSQGRKTQPVGDYPRGTQPRAHDCSALLCFQKGYAWLACAYGTEGTCPFRRQKSRSETSGTALFRRCHTTCTCTHTIPSLDHRHRATCGNVVDILSERTYPQNK